MLWVYDFTLTARGSTLDVRIDPRAVRVKACSGVTFMSVPFLQVPKQMFYPRNHCQPITKICRLNPRGYAYICVITEFQWLTAFHQHVDI